MFAQYPLKTFELGLNKRDATNPNLLNEAELIQAKNCLVGKGYIKTKNGFETYSNTLLNPVRSLYLFHKNDGSQEFLSVSNTSLYKDVSGTLTSATMTNVLNSDDVELLTYKDRNINDIVLLADGGTLKTYDGTSVVNVTEHSPDTNEQADPGLNDLSNLTNFRHIAIKKDRIFAAAHSTVKNRLSFCHRDPNLGYAVYDYWPAIFFFDVGEGDGDEITRLMNFRDGLLIFLKRSVYILYGDGTTIADYQLQKIKANGCVAPKSAIDIGNYIFYLGNDHVYSLYRTDQNYVSSEPISLKVKPILDGITDSDKIQAVAHFKDDKYYLSFPNGITLIYDINLQAWVQWDLLSEGYLTIDNEIYFAQNNQIFKFNTSYNDNSQAITYEFQTKLVDFGKPINQKIIKRLWVIAKQYEAESTTIDVEVTIDYIPLTFTGISFDESLVWDEGNWDESYWDFVDVVRKPIDINKRGTNIQIKVTNSNLNQPTEIYGFVIEYKMRKPKGGL